MAKSEDNDDIIGAIGKVALGLAFLPSAALYLAIKESKAPDIRLRCVYAALWAAICVGFKLFSLHFGALTVLPERFSNVLTERRFDALMDANAIIGALVVVGWGTLFKASEVNRIKKNLF